MNTKLKILHLEDSTSDAELINSVLTTGIFDFEILLVHSKEAFIAALDEFVPDLILSDHSLTSFNSHEALSICFDRELKIPFILITSNVSEEFAVDIIKRGADDYILKDRLERLPSAINNALEKYQLELEKESYLAELLKNERHYRSLINNCADVVIVLTAEGKFKFGSPSIQRILGYTEEEAQSLDLFDVIHPEDKATAITRWERCLRKSGQPISGYEGRIRNKDGNYIWFESTITNLLHDPVINGIVDNLRDISERKSAKVQLLKSQLFNKSILSSLDSHIAVIDKNGSIISVNKAWDDFSIANGATSAALTSNGSNYFNVCENSIAMGDTSAEDALSGLKAVLNKEIELFKLEYPCHSPTEERWFVLNATSFGGDGTNIVVSHQNITDRKIAEEKVRLNELMFRGLIENSSDGMAILSASGKPLYVSPAIKNVLGYSEAEGMELDLMGLAHPEDIHVLVNIMNDAMMNPGVAIKGGPTRMRHKDGEWRWIEGVITNMLHDPAIGGIVDNFRDITDRVLAEQSIKSSEERYRLFFENSMDGILLTITDGDIFAANPAACKIFQMTEEEICKAGLFGLVDKNDPLVAKALLEIQQTGKAKIEVNLLRKNGTIFPGEVTSAVFKDNSGLDRTSMIVRDISERKMAEQKILHVNRLYSFISQINQVIVREKDDQTLFNEACRIAVEYGKFKMAWIGLLYPDTNSIELIASWGSSPVQLEFFSYYNYEPNGPISKVVDGDDYSMVPNIRSEVKTRLSELADKSGLNSVIVLPIKNGSSLIGTFNIYSIEPNFFDEEEISLLKEATADISFAIEVFEKSKQRTKAEQQLLQSENKLSKAQSIAKLGYWEFNINNETLFWADETFQIWGRTRETFLPSLESLIETIHPDDKKFFISEHALASAGHKKLEIQYRIMVPDQSVKWVNDIGQLVIGETGDFVKFEGTVQDITARKAAEEELKKTESLYRQIVETAQEGIWLIDSQNKTTFVNNKMCQILEYTEKEMLGSELFDYMDDEGKLFALDALEDKRKGIASQADFKYITKSGREVWTNISANPFFDPEGNYSGSLAMISDITDRKILEQSLDKAITLSRMGTYEIDLVNNKVFWSAMTKEILEVPEDFVPEIGIGINFYKEGFNRETYAEALKAAIEEMKPFDHELEIITAKGNKKWVRVMGEAECHDGKCFRLYGSFQDIEKIKNAELEVLKAYEEKNDIIESIDDAFFAVDRNWIVTYWNNKAEKVLNRRRDATLNKNLWDLYPEVKDTTMWFNYHGAMADNQARHFEAHYATMDIWFEISAYPSPKGLSVFFKDITDRKSSETKLKSLNENLQKYADELLSSNKGLEQFSYIISHNLRAPVANILGLTEILQSGENDSETSRSLMEDLITNVQRLDEVIMDLNNILRVKDVLNESKEKVRITDLLISIRQSIQNMIDEESMTFNLAGVQIDEIYSLKSYMHSIFLNLVTNSIKYRRPNQLLKIEIESCAEKGVLTIIYKDNGRGIDMKKNGDNIFSLYKRFHRDIEGKGIGLFMVKTQTEILGGKVNLQSQVDKGVEFTFEFTI